mmetsp:Transcript_30160/g.77844  ORF Transcript_30160/g.77844 Transcript_30160/m.77844 type:complete len:234 (+) Transcript_30160:1674-2375(+)
MQSFRRLLLHIQPLTVVSLALEELSHGVHPASRHKLVHHLHPDTASDTTHSVDCLEDVLENRGVPLVQLHHINEGLVSPHGYECTGDVLLVVGCALIAHQTDGRLHFELILPGVLQVRHRHINRRRRRLRLRGALVPVPPAAPLQHLVRLHVHRNRWREPQQPQNLLHAELGPVREPPKNMNFLPHLPEHKLPELDSEGLGAPELPVFGVALQELVDVSPHEVLDLVDDVTDA